MFNTQEQTRDVLMFELLLTISNMSIVELLLTICDLSKCSGQRFHAGIHIVHYALHSCFTLGMTIMKINLKEQNVKKKTNN